MIYLDNNATTMPLGEVIEAMARSLREDYANPSSVHQFGQKVRHRVECAREQVATLIGAEPREMVLTSGGTESINLAIRGVLQSSPAKRHVLTTAVEHSAGMRLTEQLKKEGYRVDYVSVDREGRLDTDEWNAKLSEDTALATFIHVNNETGVIFDVVPLAQAAIDRGAVVHVDAVQSVGKMPIDVSNWPVHLVSLSAHKFHGPKGIGALYVRRRTRLEPMIVGGLQERELRAGTENVPGIVGMGVASEIALRDIQSHAKQLTKLRDRLEQLICERVDFATVNGQGSTRISNTANISFGSLQPEAILILLSEAGVCASSGAACSSGSLEPSHVLEAMYGHDPIAHSAVRFSLSRFNTEKEIDEVANMMPNLLQRLSALGQT